MHINETRVAKFIDIVTGALEPSTDEVVDEMIDLGNKIVGQLLQAIVSNPLFKQLTFQEVVAGIVGIVDTLDDDTRDAALTMLIYRLVDSKPKED